MENESESSYIFIHFVAKLTTRTPVLSKRINVWLLRFRIECSSWTSFFKVSVKENEVPTEKILVVRVFSLQRQVIYQIKAKKN